MSLIINREPALSKILKGFMAGRLVKGERDKRDKQQQFENDVTLRQVGNQETAAAGLERHRQRVEAQNDAEISQRQTELDLRKARDEFDRAEVTREAETGAKFAQSQLEGVGALASSPSLAGDPEVQATIARARELMPTLSPQAQISYARDLRETLQTRLVVSSAREVGAEVDRAKQGGLLDDQRAMLLQHGLQMFVKTQGAAGISPDQANKMLGALYDEKAELDKDVAANTLMVQQMDEILGSRARGGADADFEDALKARAMFEAVPPQDRKARQTAWSNFIEKAYKTGPGTIQIGRAQVRDVAGISKGGDWRQRTPQQDAFLANLARTRISGDETLKQEWIEAGASRNEEGRWISKDPGVAQAARAALLERVRQDIARENDWTYVGVDPMQQEIAGPQEGTPVARTPAAKAPAPKRREAFQAVADLLSQGKGVEDVRKALESAGIDPRSLTEENKKQIEMMVERKRRASKTESGYTPGTNETLDKGEKRTSRYTTKKGG